MTRRFLVLMALFGGLNAIAQSDFNTHIGAHLSNQGMSSVGYPFASESGLYGHFLPEIIIANTEIYHVEDFFMRGTHKLNFKLPTEYAEVDMENFGLETFLFCEDLRDELLSVL